LSSSETVVLRISPEPFVLVLHLKVPVD